MRRSSALLLIGAAALGCSDAPIVTPPRGASGGGGGGGSGGGAELPCAAGELLDDEGSCRPAGLPADWQEPPGPDLPGEGDVGVPPDACASGFAPVDHGCEPILPPDPCPPGTLALPGDLSCHPVADCGAGPWGAIQVDASTQFVDASNAGPVDGTAAHPWTTVAQAIDAAQPNAVVAIAAGSYAGDVVVSGKPVTLWGRCPDLVELVGAGPVAALMIDAAAGAVVRGVALRGASRGLFVQSSPGVTVERLWIHDTGLTGLRILDVGGTGVAVRDVLVEKAMRFGFAVQGGNVTVEDAVVRDTTADADGVGDGVSVSVAVARPSDVSIRRAIIERNVQTAVGVEGSALTLDGCVVRDTSPRPDGGAGWGLGARALDGLRSSVSIVGSVVERNTAFGLRINASDLDMDATVVRSTAPALDGTNAAGVLVDRAFDFSTPSVATVRRSTIELNAESGVVCASSELTVESALVRGTLPRADGQLGRGVAALLLEAAPVGSKLDLRASIVADNFDVGVQVSGSEARVERCIVRDTDDADASDLGAGVVVHATGGLAASLEISRCSLDGNVGAGLLAVGAEARVDRVRVRDTRSTTAGFGGSGVAAIDDDGAQGNLVMTRSAVASSQLTGVLLVGTRAAIEATRIVETSASSDGSPAAGVLAARFAGSPETDVTLRWSEIARNQGPALGVKAARVTLEGVALSGEHPDDTGRDHAVEVDGAPDLAVLLDGCRVERSAGTAILAVGGHVDLRATLVRDVWPREDGLLGRGLSYQIGAVGRVEGSVIEDVVEAGAVAIDSTVDFFGTRVVRVGASPDGTDGDGIAGVRSAMRIEGTHIEGVARAGLLTVGGHVAVADTTFECNPIDIDGEPWAGDEPDLDDEGGNVCGCSGDLHACRMLSAGLTPPAPIETAE